MNSFINAVSQQLDSRNGANPAWDEEGWESHSELTPDSPYSRLSLLKEWVTIFLTLAEVGLIVLMVDRRR